MEPHSWDAPPWQRCGISQERIPHHTEGEKRGWICRTGTPSPVIWINSQFQVPPSLRKITPAHIFIFFLLIFFFPLTTACGFPSDSTQALSSSGRLVPDSALSQSALINTDSNGSPWLWILPAQTEYSHCSLPRLCLLFPARSFPPTKEEIQKDLKLLISEICLEVVFFMLFYLLQTENHIYFFFPSKYHEQAAKKEADTLNKSL